MAAVLATAMTSAMAVMAFAQTVGTASSGTGSITINNAAKGETYKITKIFDATITSDGPSGSIAYLGTIPYGLETYFEYFEYGAHN